MIGTRLSRWAVLLACLLIFFLSSGCMGNFRKIKNWEYFPWNKTVETSERQRKQQGASVEKKQSGSEFRVHRIRWKGETLSIIAKWYMGRIDDWKTLADINPELDPQNLQKGEKVRIPSEKLKTSVPMPRDFLEAYIATPGNQDKRKPVKEEKNPVDTGKEGKAGKEPSGETADKKTAGEIAAGESLDKTADTGPKDETADQEQEPDLFGPKELNTQ